MGVTLERVQNKFACIIGELSNEPYILSQFAIWVDLRIAEYKAKGSIALDCTGSMIPEPTWLKGLHPPPSVRPDPLAHRGSDIFPSRNARHKRQLLGVGVSETMSTPGVPQHPTSDTARLENQCVEDSDIMEVIVKNEPQDVFPVSLHSHETITPDRINSKKRLLSHGQDSLYSDSVLYPSSSPSKSRRLSSTSDNSFSTACQDSTSNQSFLSVIGISEQPSTSTANDPATDALLAVERYEAGHGNNSSYSVSENQRFNVHPSNTVSSPSVSEEGVLGEPHVTFQAQRKTNSTQRNSASVLGICQRWLVEHCAEHRRIEEIGPEELDALLARFISEVKQNGGRDYHPNSLASLRKCLDRHLRHHTYPFSIKFSPQFSEFQKAYKLRKMELDVIFSQRTV